MTLVSRRAFSSSGYLCGLCVGNDEVAYSVETEIVLKAPTREWSFVQLRSSFPIHWEGNETGVTVTKQGLASYPAFKRFFTGILQRYGSVAVLSLLGEDKELLTTSFLTLLTRYQRDGVEGLSYQALPDGVETGSIDASLYGYTLYGPNDQLLSSQVCTPLLTSLNCLASTDKCMDEIARTQVESFSASHHFLSNALLIEIQNAFLRNATALRNTQNSDFRIEKHIYNERHERINVKVYTWNLAGLKPPKGINVSDWIGPIDREKPVFLAFGLQEVVKLTPMNSLNLTGNFGVYREWNSFLLDAIDAQNGGYSLVKTTCMVGCYVALFARNDCLHAISEVETGEIGTGFGSLLGNKGAVGVKLRYRGHSFCFINAHLPSGQSNIANRTETAQKVLFNLFSQQEKSILDLEFVYLFGDLNFRIELPKERVFSLLMTVGVETLFKYDQLRVVRMAGNSVFSYFAEAEVTFLPTYKFHLREEMHDASRTPAWTDRILYYGCGIEPLSYRRSNVAYSDHRPVSLTTALNHLR